MWGYVTGSTGKPTIVKSDDPKHADYVTAFAKWELENARVLTWFHNSVEPTIGMNFSKYDTAKEVWDYLQGMYLHSDFAKEYELESSIRAAKQHGKSIQDFYNEMTQYWDQLALMEPEEMHSPVLIEYRERRRLVQFLMALRDQFEPLRGAMLHRSPRPTVDSAVRELIAEETRLRVASNASSSPTVFVASSAQYNAPLLPTPASHLIQVTGKPKPRVATDECSFYRQKGHWKHSCSKLLQMTGQNSRSKSSSSSRPPQHYQQSSRPSQQYQQVSRPPAAFSTSDGVPPSPLFDQFQQYQASLATQPHHSQASAMTTTSSGLHGSFTTGILPTTWIFDSGCSHHMTPVLSTLSHCISPLLPH